MNISSLNTIGCCGAASVSADTELANTDSSSAATQSDNFIRFSQSQTSGWCGAPVSAVYPSISPVLIQCPGRLQDEYFL
ncbi:hypothetical protein [Flavobacterium sp.]|uniref:hypothetical protein n=1 Tax=Flavobacterium sp. TaxID=239 RepID=UPI002613B6DA|nr:hypothetical protein [Flavobacterium sp.]